jgi:membrane-bound lytic murein transglycosylase MltF
LIGIHTSYNKEKSINTGIIFTEDVMAHVFGWIEEIETPPFSVSTYDHGHNHVYTFQEYKQRHLHNSLPVKKETLNPDVKLYDFNWRLNPLERHHFTIEGEKIGKSNTFLMKEWHRKNER